MEETEALIVAELHCEALGEPLPLPLPLPLCRVLPLLLPVAGSGEPVVEWVELAESELPPLVDTQPEAERVAPPPVRDARLLPLAAPLPLPCTLARAEMLGEGEGEGVRDMSSEPVLCSDAVPLPLLHWLTLPLALVLPEVVREEEEEGGAEVEGVRLKCVDWEAPFDGDTLVLLEPL